MAERPGKRPRGLILGKFLPPHLGHVYLGDFARQHVDELTIVVGSLRREPIPGDLRCTWMKELFPDARVLHLAQELPQDPTEAPDFWVQWTAALRAILPERPDCVFASETYGRKLAEVLGAEWVPVDLERSLVPISGTALRTDPMKHWRYLPACVRPHFVRRVCVFGPESTGKTELARRLAERFETVWVAEYARPLLALQGDRCGPEDIPRIARGQLASEEALARQANRVLLCDTDVLTTSMWSDLLFRECPAWIREEGLRRRYDLTLLTDVDCPWVDDPQRFFPEKRREMFQRCVRELEAAGRSFVRISGTSWEERLERAAAEVEALLAL
ncbi:MAG: AAA family ATPase [Deltaproteobacteria bacterium]|nr:AAA family ATPase [Deltaproteobacteria bacterium]